MGQEGLFLELIIVLLGVLKRGPEDLLVAQRRGVRIGLRFLPQGAGWLLAPEGILQEKSELLLSPWEQTSSLGVLHVSPQPRTCPCQGGRSAL